MAVKGSKSVKNVSLKLLFRGMLFAQKLFNDLYASMCFGSYTIVC